MSSDPLPAFRIIHQYAFQQLLHIMLLFEDDNLYIQDILFFPGNGLIIHGIELYIILFYLFKKTLIPLPLIPSHKRLYCLSVRSPIGFMNRKILFAALTNCSLHSPIFLLSMAQQRLHKRSIFYPELPDQDLFPVPG